MNQPKRLPGWSRHSVSKIEDLADAVQGAGLSAVQLSRPNLTGTLAVAEHEGIIYNTGLIDGMVSIKGILSQDMMTLGVGLHLPPGSRQWLNDVGSGDFGVYLQGDVHDGIYMPNSLYASATLSAAQMDQVAEEMGLILNDHRPSRSGVSSRPLEGGLLQYLQLQFQKIHAAEDGANETVLPAVGRILLEAIVGQLCRRPHPQMTHYDPTGLARIVARAREFIDANLEQPLSIRSIASAAATSHRTLHRAFQAVLGEPPYSYVQRARLHRIREDLNAARDTESIAAIANRWGISELGRLSGQYREMFGELPSATLTRASPAVPLCVPKLAESA